MVPLLGSLGIQDHLSSAQPVHRLHKWISSSAHWYLGCPVVSTCLFHLCHLCHLFHLLWIDDTLVPFWLQHSGLGRPASSIGIPELTLSVAVIFPLAIVIPVRLVVGIIVRPATPVVVVIVVVILLVIGSIVGIIVGIVTWILRYPKTSSRRTSLSSTGRRRRCSSSQAAGARLGGV